MESKKKTKEVKLKPVRDKARKIPGLEHKVLTLDEIKKRKLEATLLAKLKLNQIEEEK
ncbi:MAG: hypothetical protein ACTSQA_00220 [Candidatus Heimdallarchaeaceae archaeon]